MTTFPTNIEVVVVGAGAAGLSVAKALRAAGKEVIVLESAGHIGGRCITDDTTFSVPFDRGGSWLHSAEINPLARLAEQDDRPLHKRNWDRTRAHVLGHDLTPDEITEYTAFESHMWDTIGEHGSRDVDCSTRSAVPDGTWNETVALLIPHWLAGDGQDTSAQDLYNYEQTSGDWLVEGGLGRFVADLHSNVPVRLNCPVDKIDYAGPGVSVSTAEGTIEAKHVIVTVSTGVLQRETIKFNPALPTKKVSAINNLPIGLLNKVGIEFDASWADAGPWELADYHSSGTEFCTLMFGFFGSGIATGFVGGQFADDLEKHGDQAATDFCIEALRSMFGNDVTRHIIRTDETAWRADANTLGSYSYAKPGAADARKTMAEPLADRVFFAGEATMPNAYATVHGAYSSGLRAAQELLASDNVQ